MTRSFFELNSVPELRDSVNHLVTELWSECVKLEEWIDKSFNSPRREDDVAARQYWSGKQEANLAVIAKLHGETYEVMQNRFNSMMIDRKLDKVEAHRMVR